MTFPVLTAQQRYRGSGLSTWQRAPTLLKAAFCLCSLELNTGPANEDTPTPPAFCSSVGPWGGDGALSLDGSDTGQLGEPLHLVLDNSHAFRWHRNLGKEPELKSKIPFRCHTQCWASGRPDLT